MSDTPTPRTDALSVLTKDGKYCVNQYANGRLVITRYGEFWRDETGDKLIYSLAADIDDLRSEKIKLERELVEAKKEIEQVKEQRNRAALQERQKYLPLLEQWRNCAEKLASILKRADYEIATSHIDWARFSSGSPDFDPTYKPEFPLVCEEARIAIATFNKLKQQEKE